MSGNNFSPEQLMRLLMNSKGSTADSSIAQDIIKNRLSRNRKLKPCFVTKLHSSGFSAAPRRRKL